MSIVLLATIALAGCTGTDAAPPAPLSTAPVIQPGAPGEPNKTLSAEEQAAIEAVPHTELDAILVRDMLHHHEQALIMTSYVDERSDDRDVKLLAKRMEIGQQEESDLLVQWLRNRGEPVRDVGHSHEGMPGLLTEAQMAELRAARGTEFDRLFLDFMIYHHTGALIMIEELYLAGGGLETELDVMMGHIDSDQRVEIGRMQSMYVERFGG